jgi:nucleotide-binding universal stress UspA family protein
MTNHVVVGFDSSPSSTEAVEWAALEAVARKSPLRIVACYEFPMAAGAGAAWLSSDVITSIQECTAEAAASILAAVTARHPDLQVDVAVHPGPPRTTLIGGLLPNDLLVIGTSSHGGAAGFWLGSTSRWATRHSPCPVAVVRGAASRGNPDRVVVGVDRSAASDAALLWAADEADLHGVDLLIVHAWDYADAGVDTHAEQVRDLTRIDAATVLDRATECARERCGVTVKDVLVEGRAATALLASVRDGDLLVLGAQGRGAIAAGLLGSTVNDVVEQSTAPVVVIR